MLQKLIDMSSLSATDVAKALGISRQALYSKMKGEYQFTATELIALRHLFNLTDAEFIKLVEECASCRNS